MAWSVFLHSRLASPWPVAELEIVRLLCTLPFEVMTTASRRRAVACRSALLPGSAVLRSPPSSIISLLRQSQVHFVVASAGEPLRWVATTECFAFWKGAVASPPGRTGCEHFPVRLSEEYVLSCLAWAGAELPIILLEPTTDPQSLTTRSSEQRLAVGSSLCSALLRQPLSLSLSSLGPDAPRLRRL